jgi:hypothetical protein
MSPSLTPPYYWGRPCLYCPPTKLLGRTSPPVNPGIGAYGVTVSEPNRPKEKDLQSAAINGTREAPPPHAEAENNYLFATL